jgi:hypothetical protein
VGVDIRGVLLGGVSICPVWKGTGEGAGEQAKAPPTGVGGWVLWAKENGTRTEEGGSAIFCKGAESDVPSTIVRLRFLIPLRKSPSSFSSFSTLITYEILRISFPGAK